MAHGGKRDQRSRTISIDDLSADDFVREYLALVDEGWDPNVDEFVARAPEAIREDAAQAIRAALVARQDKADAESSGVELDDFFALGAEVALEEGDAPRAVPADETDEETPADETDGETPAGEPTDAAPAEPELAPTVSHAVDLMQLNAPEPSEEESKSASKNESAPENKSANENENENENESANESAPDLESAPENKTTPVEVLQPEPVAELEGLDMFDAVESTGEEGAMHEVTDLHALASAIGATPAEGNDTIAEASPFAGLDVDATADEEPELSVPAEVETEDATVDLTGREPIVPGYRVEQNLGEGSIGTAYAAWDELRRRRVVLKLVSKDRAASLRNAIQPESDRIAEIGDPALVAFDDVVEGGDGPAFVTTCIEGLPLDEACQSMTALERTRVLRAAAHALATAHAYGVVHHDLKPENMLVTPAHNVRILDWGVGRATVPLADVNAYFRAPELSSGREAWAAADVFSFGAIMYTALTGGVPFYGQTATELQEQIRTADPLFPRSVRPDIEVDLQSICLACLARRPGERPSIAAVAADLDRFLRGEAALTRPPQYAVRLHREVVARNADLAAWVRDGVATPDGAARIEQEYRAMFENERHWSHGARLDAAQYASHAGSALVALGALLLATVGAPWGGAVTAFLAIALGTAAFWARRSGDRARGVGFAAASVAAVVAAAAALAGHGAPLAPMPLAIAFGSGLLAAIGWWVYLGRPVFAWLATLTFAGAYAAALAIPGWLQSPELAAALFVPLAVLLWAGAYLEQKTRAAVSLPVITLGAAALLIAPGMVALAGGLLGHVDIGSLGEALDKAFAFAALHGLVLLGVQMLLRRSSSVWLGRAERTLEWAAPVYVLGALLGNAIVMPGWASAAVLAVVSVAMGTLGLWRRRVTHAYASLAGLGAACVLPLWHGLATARDTALCAVGAGAVLSLGMYLFRVYSLRGKSPA
ncbi:MAG: protein kinase [Planctomycetota bacterium]|nr:protein kinase [Planctomycetota bacterium]